MSLQHKIDGVSVNAHIRITAGGKQGVDGWPNIAWYCEPGIAGITVDDPEGELDLKGWHVYTADETACTSQPRIFAGWLIGRHIQRGDYRHGPGRQWVCDIIDINALFSFETFRSTNASVRPAETDVERVQACIVSHAMAGTPIADNGRLSTAGPLNLSATNFVAQYPVDMLNNAAGQCAKNVYAYWDPDAEEVSIHYDLVGSGPTATIGFSNVIADVDDITTFYPWVDGDLEADPSGEYTGILLMSAAGNFYERNATLIDDLSPTEFSPVNFLRDLVVNSDRIGKVTTAEAYIDKVLAIHDHEAGTLRFSALLPADKVNLAMAGDVITCRFTHLPGYETGDDVIITRRVVQQYEGRVDTYLVNYECSNDASGQVGPGGGGVGSIVVPPRAATAWWSGEEPISAQAGVQNFGPPSPPFEEGHYVFTVNYLEHPKPANTYASRMGFSPAAADPVPSWDWAAPQTQAPGGDAETYTGSFDIDSLGNLTGDGSVLGGDPIVLGDSYYMNGDTAGPHSPKPDQNTLMSFSIDFTSTTGDTDPPVAPLPGAWIIDETPSPAPDGTTIDFNTAYPFVPGSLQVFVDNLNETGAVTDSDPEAGTFTLAFAPLSTERVRVTYQVAI